MAVKIYHNPRCSKSRQTLDIIRQTGTEPEIIEYLKTPLTKETISSLAKQIGTSDLRDIMRKKEEPYISNDLANKSQDNLLSAIAENPILLERPIVVTDKGALICRPPELVQKII